MQKSRNPEKDIHESFRIYDTKNQGIISIKDLRHVMTRTGEKLTTAECKFFYLIKEGVFLNVVCITCTFSYYERNMKLLSIVLNNDLLFKSVQSFSEREAHQREFYSLLFSFIVPIGQYGRF